MDKALKEKWVTALRSGEYKQGRRATVSGPTADDPHYCCLGVLAVVGGVSMRTSLGFTTEAYRFCGRQLPSLKPFIALNDEQERSFAEIADYIEKEVPTDDMA